MNRMDAGSRKSSNGIGELSALLSRERPAHVVIVTHKGADVDALASSHGVREVILGKLPSVKVTIHSIGRLPRKSRGLVEFLGLSISNDEPRIPDDSWVVFVDTGGLGTTGMSLEALKGARHVVLIDHHPIADAFQYDILIHRAFTSTSEIVLEILNGTGTALGERTATALLAGLITDTAGLREANDDTMKHLCELSSKGASISKAWEVISREEGRDEAIAKLKAAQRMKLMKLGELVAVLTEVGSYHSSVASSLVRLGADLAVVFSKEEDGSKASLRASRRFSEVSSANLGTLCSDLAKELGGHGGGHVRAGALSAPKGVEEALAVTAKFLAKHLSR